MQHRQVKRERRINQIAYRLNQNRLLLKRKGNTILDRYTAERIVSNPLRYLLFKLHQPLLKAEKLYWEPLLHWADNQALFNVLGTIGNVGILLAVLTYIGSEKHRRDAEIYQAWQTITNAHGQSGSGGRRRALEFLNASPGANWRRKFPWICAPHPICLWPSERLDGINLAVDSVAIPSSANDEEFRNGMRGVYLVGISLPNASLRSSNLSGAELVNANLKLTDLIDANLSGAELVNANLSGSSLGDANLSGAVLVAANLSGAELVNANLSGSDLTDSDLSKAVLINADLSGAVLVNANLSGADLVAVNLLGTDLTNSDLSGAVLENASLEKEQISQALLCETQLPKGIKVNPNRDCEKSNMAFE